VRRLRAAALLGRLGRSLGGRLAEPKSPGILGV